MITSTLPAPLSITFTQQGGLVVCGLWHINCFRLFLCQLHFIQIISSILNNSVGWLVGFYGILTFVGYITPNPFL